MHQGGGGFAGHKWDNDNFPAARLDDAPLFLVESFERVIAALYVNIRLRRAQKIRRARFRKNINRIDKPERGQNRGAVGFVIDGPPGAFQLAHPGVAVESDQERIAAISSSFEIHHVPGVQQIEASVGHHDFFAGGAHRFAPDIEAARRNDFGLKIHRPDFG